MENDPWKVVNDAWLKRYTLATVVMAIFTIVIAGATVQQCRMNRDNERPWVGSIIRGVAVEEKTNRVQRVEWYYRNAGKAVAKNIRVDLTLRVGDPVPRDMASLKPPTVSQCESAKGLPGDKGMVLLPGADQSFIVSPPQDVIDSSQSINDNKLGLYLVECLDYTDTVGNEHRTRVCEVYMPAIKRFLLCLSGSDAT
jgi:hypothetical protein